MTRLRTTIFALAATIAAILVPQVSSAESFNYSASTSHFIDFGELGGFTISSEPETTEIFDIGFNAGGGADLLGCAGINLDAFMNVFANLKIEFDRFLDNVKKAFFRRLLVEAFSRMPQLGALFDTINAVGNARFEMFNEGCNIDEVRADAQELIVKRCMQSTGGNAIACSPAVGSETYLKKFADQVDRELKRFHSKMRNVSNPLRGAMCEYTDTRPGCALMSFLPQFKLCYNVGVSTKTSPMGRGIDGCIETRAKRAPIGSDQLFGAAQSMAGNAINGSVNAIDNLARSMPPVQLQALSKNFQSQFANTSDATDTNIATGTTNGNIQISAATRASINRLASRSKLAEGKAFNLSLINFDYDVAEFAAEGEDKNVDKFRRFLHCTNTNPTAILEQFGEYLEDAAFASSFEIDVEEVEASDILDFESHATALTNIAIEDAGGASELIQTAVGCVLNHQLHIGLDSYIALTRLPDSDQKAFAAAAANRAAYLATEVIMRYLKQKVLEAHAQLASGFTPEETLSQAFEANGETINTKNKNNDFATPEPVLIAVKTIADMFENQIQALRAIRTERDIFAKMNSVLYDKIEEQKDDANKL